MGLLTSVETEPIMKIVLFILGLQLCKLIVLYRTVINVQAHNQILVPYVNKDIILLQMVL